ncbi:hypothetical protein Dsin_021434 [Dipteronia sinensis]|uniref:Ubiquitin-like protease family profile domain-containing protein n=1 Tax=Dipteronia sinensis TaxID=43782 RepID=A0AAD9ZZS3_9ROSI|nr:hypothetical protein Dsin_021434 [Dipteronia sinensis]
MYKKSGLKVLDRVTKVSDIVTKMRNTRDLRAKLKTPQSDWYHAKITHHNHMENLQVIDAALDGVLENGTKERDSYRQSCFGHFQRMQRGMAFSSGIIHRLLLCELHHERPSDKMRFMLGPRSIRFSNVEFCLITGLKFGAIPDTAVYEDVPNGIHHRAEEMNSVPIWQLRLVDDLDAFNVFRCLRMKNWSLQKRRGLYDTTRGLSSSVPAAPVKPTRVRLVRYVASSIGADPTYTEHARGGPASHTDRASPVRETVPDHLERRFADIIHTFDALREQVWKSDEERWSQHQVLVGLISSLQRRLTEMRTDEPKTYMYIQWVNLFGDVDKPPTDTWSVLTHTWPKDTLIWACGLRKPGCRLWHKVNTLLVPCNVGRYHWIMAHIDLVSWSIHLYDPFQQKVPFDHRNKQVACLRWLLPSMLSQAGFYTNKRSDQPILSSFILDICLIGRACLFVTPDLVAHATLTMMLVRDSLGTVACKHRRVSTPPTIVSGTSQVLGCPIGMIGTEYVSTSVSYL